VFEVLLQEANIAAAITKKVRLIFIRFLG
jgi:hypothetical protein